MTSHQVAHTTLAQTLRRLRQDAGLSQTAAAAASGLTQIKISRLERGLYTPHPTDIRQLAKAYRAHRATRAELEQIAEDLAHEQVYARVILQRGAWRLQEQIGRIEETSARVRTFHPTIVPGLSQTRAYAEAVFASWGMTGERLSRAVDARLGRQSVLGSDRELTLITTEGALRWPLGGPQVMIEQLDHMRVLATEAHGNTRVGVIPWTAPVDVVPQNGFSMYDKRAVIIATETATGTLTDTASLAAYDKLWSRLEALAAFEEAAQAVLARIMADYRRLDLGGPNHRPGSGPKTAARVTRA